MSKSKKFTFPSKADEPKKIGYLSKKRDIAAIALALPGLLMLSVGGSYDSEWLSGTGAVFTVIALIAAAWGNNRCPHCGAWLWRHRPWGFSSFYCIYCGEEIRYK